MSVEGDVGSLRKLVMDQQNQIDELKKQVTAALKQAEMAENYSRQDCLIFRGKLDIRPNHSLRDEMMRLIEFHTGVKFPPWCMNTTHWMGNGRSVIVRFNNKAVREAIYRNRVPKDPTKRGLFIHESLTLSKMELVSRCAKLRNEGKITTYYTQGGSVFVKKTRDKPSVMVGLGMTDEEIIQHLERQPASYVAAAARIPTTDSQPVEQPAPTDQPTSGGGL